ncbi:hypothetical protein HKX48_001466 [Thoreauomyces humboldtii]|nr:hypothetical protein HKX48_001466 [Thoreauomyces humboldtii]
MDVDDRMPLVKTEVKDEVVVGIVDCNPLPDTALGVEVTVGDAEAPSWVKLVCALAEAAERTAEANDEKVIVDDCRSLLDTEALAEAAERTAEANDEKVVVDVWRLFMAESVIDVVGCKSSLDADDKVGVGAGVDAPCPLGVADEMTAKTEAEIVTDSDCNSLWWEQLKSNRSAL